MWFKIGLIEIDHVDSGEILIEMNLMQKRNSIHSKSHFSKMEQFVQLNILKNWKVDKCFHCMTLGVVQKALYILVGVLEEDTGNLIIFIQSRN